MAAILLNCAEPFEQIHIPLIGPMRNLVTTGQTVSENKAVKENMILYTYIAKGQGQITPGGTTKF